MTRSWTRAGAVLVVAVAVLTATGTAPGPARAAVPSAAAAAPTDGFPRDWTGDGTADVLAIGGAGVLFVYPGNGRGGFLARRAIGTGWQNRDLVTSVGDLDRDGAPDLVARNPGTGALLLYRGNGSGGFAGQRVIGRGWNGIDMLMGPGDFNYDGVPDLLGRERGLFDGMRLYMGDGTGGLIGWHYIGYGWQDMTSLVATGDWNGNGIADFAARDRAGALWLYPSDGAAGVGPRKAIGTGWHVFTSVVGPGDFTGDGAGDLLARHRDGRLMLYAGTGTGGFRAARQIGAGWDALRLVG